MNRIRLLPVLLFGLVSLLTIKVLTVAFDGGKTAQNGRYTEGLGGQFAQSITRARLGQQDDAIVTGSVGQKPAEKDAKAKAAEPAKTDPAAAAPELEKNGKPKLPSESEGVRYPPPNGVADNRATKSNEELKLLEKLRERRDAMENRDQELEMRETLLRATERKLDERIGQLRTLEGQLDGGPGSKNDTKSRYKSLVVMYENMKPKEAARVFDRLDVRVLMDLVGHMNPRKVSEILAVMEASAAERLTVALAKQAQAGAMQAAESAAIQANDTELQRIPVATPQKR